MNIVSVNEKIKVITLYDPYTNKNRPLYLHWHNRRYEIIKIGFHHKKRVGRTMVHIYEVISETLFFRLRFDTDTLDWFLEAIADGTEI